MANYYDIGDILAEEELVPTVFQYGANGVGLFDSSDDADKVEAGSRAELPFWLVRELYLRQLVSIRVPPCFDRESKTREEIAADAAHVDLRSRSPYFYELGCKIALLLPPLKCCVYCPKLCHLHTLLGIRDRTIGPFLLVAFQTRYRDVLVKAHALTLTMTPKYLTLLTNEEIKLYEAGQSSIAAFKKWRMGGPRFQVAPVLGRKRKLT
ncbi:DNA replication complex GINS protein PSF3-like isoform X1 [Salvia hispanica]|uniref:DNA replication complex GINS protein PSF3-like isoform X1 n=1 Tax=Salvia hispanica TaxID=49212 RepID=UPI002009B06E|nr:DNA replication complex GINS protein PSF3-like isoform X1 [Salvia hispanica]XP_047969696.1 DNA replication complex GINS protein PSF3-like isoform X1 [Salvia hispanica]